MKVTPEKAKKVALFLTVTLLLAAMLSVTAFAHGGHGPGAHCGRRGSAGGTPLYPSCTVEGCEVYGPHEHDGKWYCNQSGVNWNNYGVCTVEGCTVLGLHEHDGTWYHCSNYPNGGRYLSGRGRNWQ